MKIAAGIIGLTAGFAGALGGFGQIYFGPVGKALEAEGVTGAGGFLASLIIIIFGGLAFSKPKIAGMALIVLGLLTAVAGNVISGPLAVVSGILSLLASIQGEPKKISYKAD